MTSLTKKETAFFLKRLKTLRTDLEIESITSLAKLLGVAPNSVKAWLAGRCPSVETVEKLETSLELRLIDLDREGDAIEAFLGQPAQ